MRIAPIWNSKDVGFKKKWTATLYQDLMLNLEKAQQQIDYSLTPQPQRNEGAGQGREKGFNNGRNDVMKRVRELEE